MGYPYRWMITIALTLPVSGCVSVDRIDTVLAGVMTHDVNKIRAMARTQAVDERGEKAVDGSNICGVRPLHMAIDKGHLDSVQVLLQEGANPNLPADIPREPKFCSPDYYRFTLVPAGSSPLHYALSRANREMAEALLFAGANPNLTDAEGRTAMELASKQGYSTLVAYMASPVHVAARAGDLGTLQRSVAHGAALSEPLAGTGPTPLEEGLVARKWYAVEFLLQNGAGPLSAVYSNEVRNAAKEYLVENPSSEFAAGVRRIADLPVR